MTTAKGVVMVLIDGTGRAMANASDFAPDRFGGFTLKAAQEVRCRRALAINLVRETMAYFMRPAFDAYECEEAMRRLMNNDKGYKIETISIGHDNIDA